MAAGMHIAVDVLLRQYDMDSQRGFLPATDPLLRLPPAYDAWEELLRQLPDVLIAGQARRAIEQLPLLDTAALGTQAEWERAMLLLGYFAQAYVFAAPPLATHLPAPVAVPLCAVARQLGRPPILSYAAHVLNNWRRLDPARPIALDNLARLARFYGGLDEDWFGLVHVAIEAQAAPGLTAAVAAQEAVLAHDAEAIAGHLISISSTLDAMLALLERMLERCDPAIYYLRVRPFLSGWQDNPDLPEGVVYEGVAEYAGQPQKFRGGSGAQSSIIPALDNALGLNFADDIFGRYMRSLAEYMPPKHRAFVDLMPARPSIRAFTRANAAAYPALVDAYNHCIRTMAHFRKEHLRFAATYVHAQSIRFAPGKGEVGTGGTPFMRYLNEHMREVDDYLIER